MNTLRTPVLIVGAGPAGLVTAAVLATHGVRSVLVERHPGTSIYPRATGISVRSMEILRSLGVEDDVRAFSLDAEPLVRMAPTLASPAGSVGPLGFPTRAEAAAVSRTGPVISPQDHVEPVLVARLRALGLTDLRFATELTSLRVRPDGQGAVAVVRPVDGGPEMRIEAEWVVGADGPRSAVRDSLGIEPVGPTGLERYASILFRADLWPALSAQRYGLYLVGAPGMPGSGVFVPMGPDDRWVFATTGPEAVVEALVASPGAAVAAVRAASGIADLAVEILASMPLEFSARLALRWRVGPAFLAGDAAHQMPPIGGRGMNTAIADAANLGWKLAYVASGRADPALLDSYEAERLPVARRNLSIALARFQTEARAAGFPLDLVDGTPPQGTSDGLEEDLGYAYRSGAMVDPEDGDVPTALPGRRLPHAWITIGGRRVSTLDAVAGQLVLLAAGDASPWRRAARSIRPAGPVARGLLALGGAAPLAPGVPLVVLPIDGDATALGLRDGGAILVRPDGHVAATWTMAPENPAAALVRAIGAVTGAAGIGRVARPATSMAPRAGDEPGRPSAPAVVPRVGGHATPGTMEPGRA